MKKKNLAIRATSLVMALILALSLCASMAYADPNDTDADVPAVTATVDEQGEQAKTDTEAADTEDAQLTEEESESVKEAQKARSRYLIVGGIVLLGGVGVYVAATVKSKKHR